jgi:hypothetical protein
MPARDLDAARELAIQPGMPPKPTLAGSVIYDPTSAYHSYAITDAASPSWLDVRLDVASVTAKGLVA